MTTGARAEGRSGAGGAAPPASVRVAIVQLRLRRYRLRFYEALRADLAADGIDLRLLHSNAYGHTEDRGDLIAPPWAIPVPTRGLQVRGRWLHWQSALPHLRDVDLVIVEQAAQLLVNYALLARQALRGRPRVALWGHGRNFDAHRSSGAGEAVKRWVSRRPHWWFAYTGSAADVVAGYGYPRDRITVVQNATDTRDLAALVEGVDPGDVAALRARLGLTGAHVGLYLGNLHPRKEIGFLLRAAEGIREQVPDFELVVTGGGGDVAPVVEAARRHPWIHYTGPRFGRELAAVLALARVILMPRWVGLVVVDSFAAGIPLVTSASSAHPPEISYLRDGENGLLVDDGGDPLRYAAAVAALLHDEPRRRALAEGCLAVRDHFTAEAMAERFATGVRQALAR